MIREGETYMIHRRAEPDSNCDGRLIAVGPVSNTKRLVECSCGYLCAVPSSVEPAEFEQERIAV